MRVRGTCPAGASRYYVSSHILFYFLLHVRELVFSCVPVDCLGCKSRPTPIPCLRRFLSPLTLVFAF